MLQAVHYFFCKGATVWLDLYMDRNNTLETSGEDVKTTLETSGEDVKATLETSGEDVKATLETSGEDVKTTLQTSREDLDLLCSLLPLYVTLATPV